MDIGMSIELRQLLRAWHFRNPSTERRAGANAQISRGGLSGFKGRLDRSRAGFLVESVMEDKTDGPRAGRCRPRVERPGRAAPASREGRDAPRGRGTLPRLLPSRGGSAASERAFGRRTGPPPA